MRTNLIGTCIWVLAGSFFIQPAQATFHLMQIEQVIGGVNGNTNAQAIQLRMRASGQGELVQGRLRVWNAAGASPILVTDFTTCPPVPASCVANSSTGSRILLTTSAFNSTTSPATVSDFTFVNQIPASYLAAGSLTFEDHFGTILWRVSWGGAGYTGANTGSTTNDADGNFGPQFAGALPSSGTQSLKFNGSASALSTNNAADYSLSSGAATFTNNANNGFTVQPPATGACCTNGSCGGGLTQSACEGGGGVYGGNGSTCPLPTCHPPCIGNCVGSGTVDIDDLVGVITSWGNGGGMCDINNDNIINIDDLVLVIAHWGPCP